MRCSICLLAGLVFASGLSGVGIVRAAQNVVVVLDDSGSMEEEIRTPSGRVRRIDAAKQALIAALENLPPDTNVGVVALNTTLSGSNWIVPLGPADEATWRPNIEQIRAGGGTPLGEFLKHGADALLEARDRQVYGMYRLLVVTDGEANDERLVEAYLPQILSRGIVLDVIGVDMQADHSLATRVHSYRRADDDSALAQAISEVFAETSGTDQDAEADFELLEGLPEEFASEAIRVLTTVNNEPIDGNAGGFANTTVNTSVRSSRVSRGGGRSNVLSLLCCTAGFLLLSGLAVVLFGIGIAKRKRR